MHIKPAILILFLVTPHTTMSQVFSVPRLSQPYAESGAVNSLTTRNAISLNYSNNFFLPEIGRATIGMVYPSKAVTTSAAFSFYGFSEYWNMSLSVGFSRWFKPYIAFGVEAYFYGVHFNTDASFLASGGVNVSLLAFPVKSLSIGFYAKNISFSTVKTMEERYRLPVVLLLGLAYDFSNKVVITLEGGIELKQPFQICMTVDYMPVRQFILRCDVSYQTSAAAGIGFGLRFGSFFMDFDAEYKLISGMGCKAAIGVTFNRRRK